MLRTDRGRTYDRSQPNRSKRQKSACYGGPSTYDDLRADLDELYRVSLTMTDRPSLGFRAACASALSSSSMRAPHVGHIVGLQDYARPRDGYSRRSRIFS